MHKRKAHAYIRLNYRKIHKIAFLKNNKFNLTNRVKNYKKSCPSNIHRVNVLIKKKVGSSHTKKSNRHGKKLPKVGLSNITKQ